MDELQSGPLMVQALMGRCSWLEFSKWSPYGEIPHGKTLCKVQMVKWLSNPRCVVMKPEVVWKKRG
jgi:hypothetical protein